MATYDNPKGVSPLLPLPGVPGINLPEDFNLEAADRGLVDAPVTAKPKKPPFVQPSPVRFPSRDPKEYGEGIARLIGAFSGPGFNLIFRPHSDQSEDTDPALKRVLPSGGFQIDLLELNLTHEIWTFPRANLGEIPNRVAEAGGTAKDAVLSGIPYTQIVRDVTNAESGTRVPVDRLGKRTDGKADPVVSDIHFEPGLLIHVPHSSPVSADPTISRMASIPHGTTINAQGAAPLKRTAASGDASFEPDIPAFSKTASQPFDAKNRGLVPFDDDQFNLEKKDATRLPQNMTELSKKAITKRMVQDPNELLRTHNEGKVFTEFVKFTVSTTPSHSLDKQACPHLAARKAMDAALKALDKVPASATDAITDAKKAITDAMLLCTEPTPIGTRNKPGTPTAPAFGTSNIAFLDGTFENGPNARTGKVESTFWISTVAYTIKVDKDFQPTLDGSGKVVMKDGKAVNILQVEAEEKKKLVEDTVPSFVFPADKPVSAGRYQVEATQVQYSQTVNLIFNTLVWPHISVATLIPVRPVVVNFAKKLPN